ncbi:MAG: signal peptidase I [Eubacteriales bacterium]
MNEEKDISGAGSDSVGGENHTAPEKDNKRLSAIYDWIEVVCVSVAIVIFIFTFIGRLTTVDGTSMYPTLEHGDRLVVSGLFYTPSNGDIVVLQEPNGFFEEPLVKRVIARGGQRIDFDFENWEVYVDGEKLDEPYVNYEIGKAMKSDSAPESLVVPEGYIFVMGDNRNGSTDSRSSLVGFVSEDYVMGKVLIRILPLSRIGVPG